MREVIVSNPLNANDPAAVFAAIVERVGIASQRVINTVKRLKDAQSAAPAVKAEILEDMVPGMLVGILDNQVLIFAALTHLMREAADRHAARIELARPGIQGINGGRLR